MLKGIDPLLNAELLQAMRAMGHGDELVVADANFPAATAAATSTARVLLRMDVAAPRAVRALLGLLPLDDFDPALRMEPTAGDPFPQVQQEVQAELDAALGGGPRLPMGAVEYRAFHARARTAYAVLQTAEPRFWGCFILRKGVIAPAAP